MGFLLGGLLSGIGGGITANAAQKREDALIALRRQYQQEDQAAEETREIAKEDRVFGRQKELLKLGTDAAVDQAVRTEQGLEPLKTAAQEAEERRIEEREKREDARWVQKQKFTYGQTIALETWRNNNPGKERPTVLAEGVDPKTGNLAVTFSDGQTIVTPVKPKPSSRAAAEGEGEGEVFEEARERERQRQGGTLSPKPKGVASAAPANAAALRAEAQAAINNGAPRAAVAKRFKELTGQAL